VRRKHRKAGTLVRVSMATAALGLPLAGCAMIDGLETSGTLDLVIYASAANAVLLDQGIRIASVPVCETDQATESDASTGIKARCVGETWSGRQIDVTVTNTKDMTISVADRQVFQGPLDAILQENLQVPSS
jgi:hypothetical protein